MIYFRLSIVAGLLVLVSTTHTMDKPQENSNPSSSPKYRYSREELMAFRSGVSSLSLAVIAHIPAKIIADQNNSSSQDVRNEAQTPFNSPTHGPRRHSTEEIDMIVRESLYSMNIVSPSSSNSSSISSPTASTLSRSSQDVRNDTPAPFNSPRLIPMRHTRKERRGSTDSINSTSSASPSSSSSSSNSSSASPASSSLSRSLSTSSSDSPFSSNRFSALCPMSPMNLSSPSRKEFLAKMLREANAHNASINDKSNPQHEEMKKN
ncbi:MAG: hypothetical protein NTX86_03240 [Candidatus Dependentiae bacterium]|nr:hypothetical protein [Candidatus Dependentiae bacterium]